MNIQFKSLIFIILLANLGYAQKNHLLSERLEANKNTQLNIDLRNAYVRIEASPDQHIYVDYNIDFKNYDVKDIQDILTGITTNIEEQENSYVLKIDSKHKMSSKVYSLESSFGLTLDEAITTNELTKRKFRKTKESLIKTAAFDESKAEVLMHMLKEYKSDGTTKDIDFETIKSYQVNFTIKIPETIGIYLKLNHSEVVFNAVMTNAIICQANHSTIRSDGFKNNNNVFEMKNGTFKVVDLVGGRYDFKDVGTVIIGGLKSTIINSEFCEFSFGEIDQNTIVNDFNSEFWLYNFSHDLGTFVLNSEYSKVNIYYPEDSASFSLSTFGYATIHYLDNTIIDIPPSKKKKASKMLEYGDKVSAKNKIKINIVNGIVRLGKDFIDVNK